MNKRFAVIWFRHLKTDWFVKRQPQLKKIPFVLASPHHGRIIISEASAAAKQKGIYDGMVVSDAKVVYPSLEILDDKPHLAEKLLQKIALWCIRFTPVVSIDLPDIVVLDVTGCTHLWNGEEAYLRTIISKLKRLGYHVKSAMADTVGAAWALAKFSKSQTIIEPGQQKEVLYSLPAAALRLDDDITATLDKLGLYTIGSFFNMQPSVLKRRFGQQLLTRINQALGLEEEYIVPVVEVSGYIERLPCIEPIKTKAGIEITLTKLLEALCATLKKEGKGLRSAIFTGYRIDNKTTEINISINHSSNNTKHLFKLFELRIAAIEPALGIELFTLEAKQVEDLVTVQQTFWTAGSSLESKEVAELLDNIQSRFGSDVVRRYLPSEHHWPERSIQLAASLKEQPATEWSNKRRPVQLLAEPQPIEVTAPIPDYPPMNFRYKGELHTIGKADACERIEAEWWLELGLHRDYYIVEDTEGIRYWVFRLGHYSEEEKPQWFLHGLFA